MARKNIDITDIRSVSNISVICVASPLNAIIFKMYYNNSHSINSPEADRRLSFVRKNSVTWMDFIWEKGIRFR
jgi:hypothetical protein